MFFSSARCKNVTVKNILGSRSKHRVLHDISAVVNSWQHREADRAGVSSPQTLSQAGFKLLCPQWTSCPSVLDMLLLKSASLWFTCLSWLALSLQLNVEHPELPLPFIVLYSIIQHRSVNTVWRVTAEIDSSTPQSVRECVSSEFHGAEQRDRREMCSSMVGPLRAGLCCTIWI